jgi:hypothetical protein
MQPPGRRDALDRIARRSSSRRTAPRSCRFSGHEDALWKVLARSVTKVWWLGRGRFRGNAGWVRPFWTMRFEREHSRWPPLRLAQLCREHVSVCVVLPVTDEVVQVREPALLIIGCPLVQLALDPEYPRLRHLQRRPRRVAIQRRPPRLPDGRCKPAAFLRHVPGFPRRRLLRRLRPEPGPSADTALCPKRGRSGSVPMFTVVRSTGSAPSFSPAVPVATVTQHPSRTPGGTKLSPPEARNPRDRRAPAHRFGSPYPSGWSCVES